MTYGIDLSICDDIEERAIVVYHYMTQRMHRLFQPVPQEVLTRQMVERHREDGDARMMHDYFGPNCTWGPKKFHQRLGMYRPLFLRILSEIVVADPAFDFQVDCTGKLGHSPHMKMDVVMKCLCKGIAADSTDDYVRMGAPTVYMYVKRFTRVIVRRFGPRYMRLPTREDTKRLLAENAARGFPGMLENVDCMHFRWKNCPTAWAGTFCGHEKKPTMILEAVASYDRWFWHGFFGTPGSNNDLNVLAQSPLFDKMVNGLASPCNYRINGHSYDKGYYLADNIYPPLSCIVQSFKILLPNQPANSLFNKYQQTKRKDVERAFGTLQNKFQITKKPACYWDKKDINFIIKACLIFHNMVIENERRNLDWGQVVNEPIRQVTGIPRSYHALRNDEAYLQLRNDLVQHIWIQHGLGHGDMPPESLPPPPDDLDGSDGEFDPTDVYPAEQL
ncbi:putative nuclease HARBI1 [Papaver somniferum]|uniref:putative nuclease HARBI1 n=1 Tax=Papaver somniferum TaxID=3469 RepID=UPI000E6FD79A|nr:putative nuclease HARBI1 [Papaver somniferum]